MEIGNNIVNLRKKSGLSQEELAEKVFVSSKAVSKWETGQGFPDVRQAKELSKIFKVSLDELADNDIKEILVEKTTNTEKLAGLILKLIKFIIIFIIVVPIILVGARIISKNIYEKNAGRLMTVSVECTLHDETYSYEFVFYETTGQIKYAGGDGYIANITDIDKYNDAHQAIDIIDAYVKNNGGTCKISEAKPYEE